MIKAGIKDVAIIKTYLELWSEFKIISNQIKAIEASSNEFKAFTIKARLLHDQMTEIERSTPQWHRPIGNYTRNLS